MDSVADGKIWYFIFEYPSNSPPARKKDEKKIKILSGNKTKTNEKLLFTMDPGFLCEVML